MGIFSDDTWTVGTADQDGQPIIIRVRSQMPDAAARQGHGQLIVVGWPYDGTATGLPGAEDNASMQAFEDAIEAGLERSGVGVQVGLADRRRPQGMALLRGRRRRVRDRAQRQP